MQVAESDTYLVKVCFESTISWVWSFYHAHLGWICRCYQPPACYLHWLVKRSSSLHFKPSVHKCIFVLHYTLPPCFRSIFASLNSAMKGTVQDFLFSIPWWSGIHWRACFVFFPFRQLINTVFMDSSISLSSLGHVMTWGAGSKSQKLSSTSCLFHSLFFLVTCSCSYVTCVELLRYPYTY